ncbi:MAG TPA: hypothetical protein VK789_31625 [Bryobacteraceae bacterium]|nr:hypothetical protein [Bryobacteraceae bacterium]
MKESKPWTQAPFAELTAHIIDRYHAFVRSESVRLGALAEKVSTHHGKAHPELTSIKEIFAVIAQELSTTCSKKSSSFSVSQFDGRRSLRRETSSARILRFRSQPD